MDLISQWWWLGSLVLTWGALFLSSGRREFSAYYPGGLWSVLIGIAIEFVIRRHLGFWNLEQTIVRLWRVELVTFIGPRFVEGVLFFQFLPKQTSLQLPAAVLWALVAIASDVMTAALGYAHLNVQTAAASLLSHLLRFTALIALFYGLSYELRAERLGAIYRQQVRQRVGKRLWKLSWIPFYLGIRAYVGFLSRRQAKR